MPSGTAPLPFPFQYHAIGASVPFFIKKFKLFKFSQITVKKEVVVSFGPFYFFNKLTFPFLTAKINNLINKLFNLHNKFKFKRHSIFFKRINISALERMRLSTDRGTGAPRVATCCRQGRGFHSIERPDRTDRVIRSSQSIQNRS